MVQWGKFTDVGCVHGCSRCWLEIILSVAVYIRGPLNFFSQIGRFIVLVRERENEKYTWIYGLRSVDVAPAMLFT